ncbi:hypothetical protein MIR68_006151 [Amoeboaphelidium protococcarum]|nr:hypothetical protein MIR68_006151 [Amoeboaphelidium protococcarum]
MNDNLSDKHTQQSEENERLLSVIDVGNVVQGSYTALNTWLIDFKKFIARSSTVNVGLGIIIGGIFSQLVSSFLKDILMPPLELGFGNSLVNLFIVLKPGKSGRDNYTTLEEAVADGAFTENYGQFLQILVQFLIIVFILYWLIKAYTSFTEKFERELKISKGESASQSSAVCPHCLEQVKFLASRCPHCTSQIQQ